jgi:hypothetical protein
MASERLTKSGIHTVLWHYRGNPQSMSHQGCVPHSTTAQSITTNFAALTTHGHAWTDAKRLMPYYQCKLLAYCSCQRLLYKQVKCYFSPWSRAQGESRFHKHWLGGRQVCPALVSPAICSTHCHQDRPSAHQDIAGSGAWALGLQMTADHV